MSEDLHETSQLLAIYTDGEGNPTRGYSKQDVAELYERLWAEFADSPVGRELLSRGGRDILDRVMEIYADRYATRPPTVMPAFEALTAIGQDLLVDLPVPVVQKTISRPEPKPAPVVAAPQPSSECKQFAHLLNAEIRERGVPKLLGGFYTITANGTRYQYPYDDFQSRMNEAIRFNLIH